MIVNHIVNLLVLKNFYKYLTTVQLFVLAHYLESIEQAKQ